MSINAKRAERAGRMALVTADKIKANVETELYVKVEPLADDVLQCQLKPLRKDDYPVTFTADQWSRP